MVYLTGDTHNEFTRLSIILRIYLENKKSLQIK